MPSDSLYDDEAVLVQLQARIADVEDGLQSLQIQRKALACQSATLVANIAAKRVRHAPMRTLLPEICDIIFAYCAELECSLDCSASNPGFEKSYPVTLAAVCRRWRTMVLQNPGLWSTLHLRPTMNNVTEINKARFYLSRSADMPLRVTICPEGLLHMDWDIRSISATIAPLMRFLAPNFDRIQSLKTHLGMEILPVMFPPGQITRMSMLEELHLLMDDQRISASSHGRLCSPRLRNLHVRDITPLFEALHNALPVVETLVVTECQSWKFPRVFPRMLAKFISLRSCSISFPSALFFADLDLIELPELQSLTLEWPFLFEPTPIFNALRAPNLRKLRIVHLSRQLVVQPQTLSSLKGLLKSAPKLSFLSVTGCNLLTEYGSIGLLQECKNIDQLEINNCLRGDRFLVPLTPINPRDSDTVWLCPMLTHIIITGIHDSDVRPIINCAKNRSGSKVSPASSNKAGGKFLTTIVLDTNSHHLSRQARLLLLSSLSGMQGTLKIFGPFGELFGAKS